MDGCARPVISRQGGKFYSYKRIIPFFPDDYTDGLYVEPFVGGGSIFFNTEPTKSVINDFDSDLISVYKIVKAEPEEVARRVNGTYVAKDFYEMREMKPSSEIGKVAQNLILTRLSFLSAKRVFKQHRDREKILTIDLDFKPYAERLADTTILNKDYQSVIRQYDSTKTFFYLDPPYENSTQTLDHYNDIDLENLRDILKQIKGRFLLSLNNSKTNRSLFKEFHITKLKTYYRLKGREVTELLISNYR